MKLRNQILSFLENGNNMVSVYYKGKCFCLIRASYSIELSDEDYCLDIPLNLKSFNYEKEVSEIESAIKKWDSLEIA